MSNEKEALKYFSIIVMGAEPAQAEEGELNKSTGLPQGPTTKIKLAVGAVAIPNFSKVWAKRKKNTKTDVPTGELEFLPWGTAGGELVSIRYLEGVSTLDKHYQETVLKIKQSEEESNETAYINLDLGINDFDRSVADPKFIEMLEHHTYNEDNKSRKKGAATHFRLYNPANVNRDKLSKMRDAQAASKVVLDAENDTEKLVVLAKLFDLDPLTQNEVIFKDMLEILEENPQQILKVVNFHKERTKYQVQSLLDTNALEFINGDLFENVDNVRETVANDIEAKDIVLYLTENILDPEVYKIVERVGEITDLQLAQLQ